MKLRNRLTLGLVLILVLAFTGVCSLMAVTIRQNVLAEATRSTGNAAEELLEEWETVLFRFDLEEIEQETARTAVLRYFFSRLAEGMEEEGDCVLQTGEEEFVNESGVNARAALAGGKEMSGSDGNVLYCVVSAGGRSYCVAGVELTWLQEQYTVSVVRDITSDMAQVRSVIGQCIALCALTLLLTAVCCSLFLRQSLIPLEQMRESAESLAAGQYSLRIGSERQDELGDLAHSFDRMAEAVQTHVEEVEAFSETQNQFLHALAHEMRTPVTAISSYASLLRTAKLTEEQRSEGASLIGEESRRLERLYVSLTQLMGLDSGKTELSELSLEELGRRLSLLLMPQAEKAGITLSVAANGTDTVTGNMDLLLVFLTNLFDNARKAGADRVDIALRREELSVRDNGCGIAAEQLSQIEQPFYQGDASRRREGFGLGLAICRKIADLHGGRLQVESSPGEGSCFSLRF